MLIISFKCNSQWFGPEKSWTEVVDADSCLAERPMPLSWLWANKAPVLTTEGSSSYKPYTKGWQSLTLLSDFPLYRAGTTPKLKSRFRKPTGPSGQMCNMHAATCNIASTSFSQLTSHQRLQSRAWTCEPEDDRFVKQDTQHCHGASVKHGPPNASTPAAAKECEYFNMWLFLCVKGQNRHSERVTYRWYSTAPPLTAPAALLLTAGLPSLLQDTKTQQVFSSSHVLHSSQESADAECY